MADENVSMDAKINVNQDRVLTRDDELRLFALQIATKDRLHFDRDKAEPDHVRALEDARAYYAFLTGNTDQETSNA